MSGVGIGGPTIARLLGRRLLRWRDRTCAEPDDGLVLVLPNPLNPDRVLDLVLAVSALRLQRMTSSCRRDLPQWARYEGEELVEKGYHGREGLAIELETDEAGRR